MEGIKFTYWPMKGYGEYLRLSLAYLGIEYTESNPDFEGWAEQRKTLLKEQGFSFPNVPCIQDGDVFISESLAIPKYLARKLGRLDLLAAGDPLLATRFNEVQGVMEDIKSELMRAFFIEE